MSDTVAIILARGGSKGVPLKNIRNFNGKPLIARAIEEAKSSNLIDEVYVSTDNILITNISKLYGAITIFRPEELSSDKASSVSGLLHAIDFIEKTKKQTPKNIILLQCTAPFFTSSDIDGVIEKLTNNNVDSVVAVTKFHHFIWGKKDFAFGINHDGKIRKRRQDADIQYIETGSIYGIKVSTFLKENSCFCGKTDLYEIDPINSYEIDSPLDFYICEKIAQWNNDKSQENYKNKAKNLDSRIKNSKIMFIKQNSVLNINKKQEKQPTDYKVSFINSNNIFNSLNKESFFILLTNKDEDLAISKTFKNALIFTTRKSSPLLIQEADYILTSTNLDHIIWEINILKNSHF